MVTPCPRLPRLPVPKNARGFTLVEVLLVMCLSFISMMGLIALQVVAVRANGFSRGMTEAVGLAQDKVEILNHTPIASLAASTENNIGVQPGTTGPYTRTVTLSNTATASNIKVNVTWLDLAGKAHNVNLYSLRAQ